MASAGALVRAWWRRRAVVQASAVVLGSAVLALASMAWRIQADGTAVHVADLAQGHRYLVVPFVVLVVLVCSVAGSISASESHAGQTAVLATTARSLWRGLIVQVGCSALAATVWFVILAVAIAVAAAGMVAVAGGGPAPSGALIGPVLILIGRSALVVVGLSALTVSLGFVLPGSSIPAGFPVGGILLAEWAAFGLTSGHTNVVLGGSYAVAIAGGPQGVLASLSPVATAAVAGAYWLGCVVAAVGVTAAASRWLTPPS